MAVTKTKVQKRRTHSWPEGWRTPRVQPGCRCPAVDTRTVLPHCTQHVTPCAPRSPCLPDWPDLGVCRLPVVISSRYAWLVWVFPQLCTWGWPGPSRWRSGNQGCCWQQIRWSQPRLKHVGRRIQVVQCNYCTKAYRPGFGSWWPIESANVVQCSLCFGNLRCK